MKDGERIAFIANLSASPADAPVRDARFRGSYADRLSGRAVDAGEGFQPRLAPWDFRILASR